EHLAAKTGRPVEHPQQRQVKRAVIEHPEEENDVERLQLEKLVREPEGAVDPSVRARETALPPLVEVRVLLEVREDELGRPRVLVDPERVDAVLRADLEYPLPKPVTAAHDVLETLRGDREVDVFLRHGRRTLVSNGPRVADKRRVGVELLAVVVEGDV